MIKAHCQNRIIGHLSRDSTAIEAREKVTNIKENKVKTPQKRGFPKNGEVRIKAKTVVE